MRRILFHPLLEYDTFLLKLNQLFDLNSVSKPRVRSYGMVTRYYFLAFFNYLKTLLVFHSLPFVYVLTYGRLGYFT